MFILYDGPSANDKKPIVVIATKNSKNDKTGDMWQTWIMRSDIEPHLAIKTGDDFSVCGNCPLRPSQYKANGLSKPCYVRTFHAPLAVFRAYKRGNYKTISAGSFRKLLRGSAIRLGSYGDPGSLPYEFFKALGIGSGEFKHTAYTHAWLLPNFDPRLLEFCMVSIDPVSQESTHIPEGRWFRVINDTSELQTNEIICPETTIGIQCADCGLCAGSNHKAKNIAIVIHR